MIKAIRKWWSETYYRQETYYQDQAKRLDFRVYHLQFELRQMTEDFVRVSDELRAAKKQSILDVLHDLPSDLTVAQMLEDLKT